MHVDEAGHHELAPGIDGLAIRDPRRQKRCDATRFEFVPGPDGYDAAVLNQDIAAFDDRGLGADLAVTDQQLLHWGPLTQFTSASSGPARGLMKNSLPGSCGMTEEGIHISGPYFSVTHSVMPW